MMNIIFSKVDMNNIKIVNNVLSVQGADKSLARPTSRCILFDG